MIAWGFQSAGVLLGASLIPTTTALSYSPNPVVFGQAITVTATVTPSDSTGMVIFYDGTIVLGSRPIMNGQASIMDSFQLAGNHTLNAYYSGDSMHAASSVTVLQSVGAAPTTTILSSPVNPAKPAQNVVLPQRCSR